MSKNDKDKKNTCDINSGKEKEHTPVENHAAAWAGIEKQKSEGKVPIPSIDNVEDAKDWVDQNKK